MNQIDIFSTGYVWNWLHTLNRFLDGAAWGAGLVLVFLVFILLVNKSNKKDEP